MKEDIYCIACQCQTIINKQIKVSHNKIIDNLWNNRIKRKKWH